jgi:hypothetical protein
MFLLFSDFNIPAFRHCLPSVVQQLSLTSRCLAMDVTESSFLTLLYNIFIAWCSNKLRDQLYPYLKNRPHRSVHFIRQSNFTTRSSSADVMIPPFHTWMHSLTLRGLKKWRMLGLWLSIWSWDGGGGAEGRTVGIWSNCSLLSCHSKQLSRNAIVINFIQHFIQYYFLGINSTSIRNLGDLYCRLCNR